MLTHVCARTCSSPYSLSHFSRASAPWAPPTGDPKESMRYQLWIFFFHFLPLTLIFIRQNNPLRTGNTLITTFFDLIVDHPHAKMRACFQVLCMHVSYSLFLFVSVPLDFQKIRYWAINWFSLSVSTVDKRAGTESLLMVRAHPWGRLLIAPVFIAIWQGARMPAELLQSYNA